MYIYTYKSSEKSQIDNLTENITYFYQRCCYFLVKIDVIRE